MSIVITGNPGVGKHTITKKISEILNFPIIDINIIAKDSGLFEKNENTNDVDTKKSNFRLTIIPHTIANTLFKTYKVRSYVNIETDMFARYVFNMFKTEEDTLSWDKVDKIMANY